MVTWTPGSVEQKDCPGDARDTPFPRVAHPVPPAPAWEALGPPYPTGAWCPARGEEKKITAAVDPRYPGPNVGIWTKPRVWDAVSLFGEF